MKTADESSSLISPQLGEDPEEEGLRILAKVIARKLAKSRRDKYARAYEQGEGDSPASGDDG
jgi:hypothetical protein